MAEPPDERDELLEALADNAVGPWGRDDGPYDSRHALVAVLVTVAAVSLLWVTFGW